MMYYFIPSYVHENFLIISLYSHIFLLILCIVISIHELLENYFDFTIIHKTEWLSRDVYYCRK